MTQRPPFYTRHQIRTSAVTWTWGYPLELIGKDQFPIRQQYWPLPIRATPPEANLGTWIESYPLMLIGKDILPIRQMHWPLTPAPLREPDLRTWDWSYNYNLVGKDRLPTGTKLYDLTVPAPLRSIDLLTWTFATSRALLAGPVAIPFKQTDWPVPRDYLRAPPSWASWLNYNLIGKDQLPVGTKTTELPPRDFVRSPPSFAAWFNLNLTGQDKLPNGETLSDLPPRDFDRSIQLRTWIHSISKALEAGPQIKPINQTDWPVPRDYVRAPPSWTASYNPNLIGKDQLPNGEQYLELPPRDYERSLALRTWIQSVNAALVLIAPFSQSDWPVPRAHFRTNYSSASGYNLDLIGQDRLPSGEQFTDLPPRDHLRSLQLRTWIDQTKIALTAPIQTKPFNQQDWPNPRDYQHAVQQTAPVGQHNINLFPAPPPPPVSRRPTIKGPLWTMQPERNNLSDAVRPSDSQPRRYKDQS